MVKGREGKRKWEVNGKKGMKVLPWLQVSLLNVLNVPENRNKVCVICMCQQTLPMCLIQKDFKLCFIV